MASILIVEDNETIREGVAAVAAKMGHKTHCAADGPSGLKIFSSRRVDFTITDLKMTPLGGLEVLKAIRAQDEDAVVMLMTAYGTVETAVEAMKVGAFDFITKPFTPEVLRAKINQALEVAQLRRDRARLHEENQLLRAEAHEQPRFAHMIGNAPPMHVIFSTIQKVAPSDSTVLITGESGTGKELVARALHELSRRRDKAFIRLNCGALAETLLESEMFGHEKGAFTGAAKRKLGRFELADGGTLFLDEIGEIGPALQLKLLRVLQEREFERVGGEETLTVDVRVIAATNQNLEELVAASRFREDLYYRLHIVPIQLPALRERLDDIEPLAMHFVKKLQGRTGKRTLSLTPEALEILRGYRWPGNVRELENVIEQAMVFSSGEVLDAVDLPSNIANRKPMGSCLRTQGESTLTIDTAGRNLPDILDEVEKYIIQKAYEQSGKVKTECARLLGVKTSALYYKLEKYGIE